MQVTLDKQIPRGAQRSPLPGEPLFRPGCRLCGRRARPASGPLGWHGCQALAGAGHGASDRSVHLGHEMKRTDVMRDIPEHLDEGGGRERRAIGRDTAEGQVACRQGRFESLEKRPDVVVGGIVIQDVIEDALVAAIIDRREHTERSVIALIGGHIA